MTSAHVEDLLIAHVRGELEAEERGRVERHLAECGDCRAAHRAFAGLMDELARTAPLAPPLHWGAYRAELREKLERRTARRASAWTWVGRPLPAALAAGLVAALLYAGLPGGGRNGPPSGPFSLIENSILASRFEVIAQLDLVQRLDALEDFDVIGGLDRLTREG